MRFSKIILIILAIGSVGFGADEAASSLIGESNIATSTTSTGALLKKLGFQFVADVSVSNAEFSRLGSSGLGQEDRSATSLNYVSPSYKINDKTTLALRQYWTHDFSKSDSSSDKQSWTMLTLNLKQGSLLGSQALAPTFYAYLPFSGNASLDNGKGENLRHNGILRMDVEADWDLNTKWTVGYYLSPRQSFLPGEQNIYNDKGEVSRVAEATSTLVHYGVVYYNITDKIQPYTYLGMKNLFLTNKSLENSTNIALVGLGANLNLNKNVTVVAELNQDENIDLKKNVWDDSNNLVYELTLAISL